jgi:hypothetical protein
LTFPARFTAVFAFFRFAFGSRREHCQRNSLALAVNFNDPHLDDIAHRHERVSIFDVAVGNLADMHQP